MTTTTSTTATSESSSSFLAAVKRCIPSEFNLISGNEDTDEAQESYVASRKFQLPNALGAEGGVATSAFLDLLYKNQEVICRGIHGRTNTELTCHEVLQKMYQSMKETGFDSVPQFSSSRPLDEKDRSFYVVPPGFSGRRRALLIGVNFMGQKGQLRAPHNDCHNVEQFLLKIGFQPQDMIVLVDDGKHTAPTRKNIEDGFAKITQAARARDAVFVSYSGHGGRVLDKTNSTAGKETYKSSIFPVDFAQAGQILDEEIMNHLIKAMPAGVHTTMLVDCCHSGSVGKLPFRFPANAKQQIVMDRTTFNIDTREEILAKQSAADQAEVDRKAAKAERKAAREALRAEKRLAAEQQAAAAPAAATTAPVMMMPPQMMVMPPVAVAAAAAPPTMTTHTFDATSEEEAQKLAAQFGASLTITKEQKDVMAKGGKITCTVMSSAASPQPMMMMPGQPQQMMMMMPGQPQPMMMMMPGQPVMMTPEQAAAFAAQQQQQAAAAGGGNVQVMMGSPMTPEQAAAFAKQQQGGGTVQYMVQK